MPNIKLPSLNGLRALSIIIVIFSHLKIQTPENSVFWRIFKYFPLITDGAFGVNVFFIISGFLITTLLLNEELESGRISLKRFYIRRVLRIFPAYYFLLIVYFIFYLFHLIQIKRESWLTAITYTKYFNWRLDWITAHFWSLSVEEHFYLIWPVVFLFGEKKRRNYLFIALIACPIFRFIGLHYTPNWLNDLTIFQRLDSIALGCLLAIYKEKIFQWNKINSLLYFSIAWLLIGPFILKLSMCYHLHIGWLLVCLGGSIGTITNLAISAILLYSIFKQNGIWFKFLNSKIMYEIGILSYSLYLWQQIFISNILFGRDTFPYNLLLIIATALFSYHFIEKPFLKLKTRFSST